MRRKQTNRPRYLSVILSEATSNELAQSKDPTRFNSAGTRQGVLARAEGAKGRESNAYPANSFTASRNTLVCRSTSSASVCGDISAML